MVRINGAFGGFSTIAPPGGSGKESEWEGVGSCLGSGGLYSSGLLSLVFHPIRETTKKDAPLGCRAGRPRFHTSSSATELCSRVRQKTSDTGVPTGTQFDQIFGNS